MTGHGDWVEGMCTSVMRVYQRPRGPRALHSLCFHCCHQPEGHFLPHLCPTCGSSWLNGDEPHDGPLWPPEGPERPPAA